MGVDVQIQIYIMAGVFGLVAIIIIFFLAGICGQLSKIKRQQRDQIGNNFSYDNYAYTSRTIQPDEELDRRGYVMYDPYHRNSHNGSNHVSPLNARHTDENGKYVKTQSVTQQPQQQQQTQPQSSQQQHQNNVKESLVTEGSRDLANEYSIKNSETVVMTGNDIEMKIKQSHPPEFRVEPPPAFQNN